MDLCLYKSNAEPFMWEVGQKVIRIINTYPCGEFEVLRISEVRRKVAIVKPHGNVVLRFRPDGHDMVGTDRLIPWTPERWRAALKERRRGRDLEKRMKRMMALDCYDIPRALSLQVLRALMSDTELSYQAFREIGRKLRSDVAADNAKAARWLKRIEESTDGSN